MVYSKKFKSRMVGKMVGQHAVSAGGLLPHHTHGPLGPAGPHTVLLLLLAGTLASELGFEVRPERLSWVFLAAVLHLLHRRSEGLEAPPWLLPPLFLVWANCHSLFILGWLAMPCCLAGLLLRHRCLDGRLGASLTACVGARLLNPYGLRGVVFPFTLGTRLQGANVFAQSIDEFTSPFALGLFHYFRGDPSRAASLFAQAIQANGGRYYEIYQNLGSALYRLGRYVQARDCYRVVLDEHSGDRLAARRLHDIQQHLVR